MDVAQPFIPAGVPIVEPSTGVLTDFGVALLRAFFNRTGKEPGVDSADLQLLELLSLVRGPPVTNAQPAASAALIQAITTRPVPAYNDVAVMALLLANTRRSPWPVYFGTGVPTVFYSEGAIYFDTSPSPYNGYVQHSGAWNAFS